MKIRVLDGRMTAEAENEADIIALLELKTGAKPSGQKYKKACLRCGKRVKYLETHIQVMHGKGRLLGAVRGEVAGKT